MLDKISDLVRNVAVIVLMAGFLEMLLPEGGIKRFVKVVLGLFILVSILNPLLSFFDRNVTSEVLAWQDPVQSKELNTILRNGEKLSREMSEKAVDMYARNLGKQIETIVKLVKGVAWVEADVEMSESGKNPDYNKISRVVLVIGTGGGSPTGNETERKEKIAPIEINISEPKRYPGKNPDDQQIEEQVTEALKSFYNLREEQIHIVLMSQDEEGTKIE